MISYFDEGGVCFKPLGKDGMEWFVLGLSASLLAGRIADVDNQLLPGLGQGHEHENTGP